MDIIAPNEPTYYPVNQHYHPSTIDLGLAKGIQNISVSTSEDLSSDHNPVYFLVGLDNIILEPQNQILLTNWSKFNRNLSNTMCRNPLINDLNELDKAVDNFALSIQTAINQSTGFLTTLPLLVVKEIGSSPVFTTGFSNSSRYSLCTGCNNSEFSVFMRTSLICPSRPGITFRTRARLQYERLLLLFSSRTISSTLIGWVL
ncbi:hypothetical protein NPIL_443711 [Nephila pilipes]|uniref:Endonuclease/exonuclease/phosphatase domain-containing protein n=1 Tax=Nephila pilipes TaxID=299642 RepID=A0A8X6TV16_NEPPI|nr:hypothetical protein NPIL_443711 [Nephila pilipes]